MRIGELATQTDMTRDAIRYYERIGLLAPAARSQNGYREYQTDAAEDLRFIRKAQVLGLRLTDIREVMALSDGGEAPCSHVRLVVTEHLAQVERKLKELRELRSTLKTTLTRLDEAPEPVAGCRCSAIESA